MKRSRLGKLVSSSTKELYCGVQMLGGVRVAVLEQLLLVDKWARWWVITWKGESLFLELRRGATVQVAFR